MLQKFIFVALVTLYSYGFNLPKIKDIAEISQNFAHYALDLNQSFESYNDEFITRYYHPWDIHFDENCSHFEFGAKYIQGKTYFGDNKQQISAEQIEKILLNQNATQYPSMKHNGVTIRNTDCRLLPTSKPFFYDFKKASGGYPFDYMQNSMIHINTPIKILHYSLDKAFVFVEAPYVSGWISSSDIAFVTQEDIKTIKLMQLVTPKIDDISLLDEHNFISKTYIGAIFWKSCDDYLYFFKSDANSSAVLAKIRFNGQDFSRISQQPNAQNLTRVAFALYGQNYGWGGFLQNRDCSMMVRDFYTSFGVFLPRNSFDQAHDKPTQIITLAGKSREEKKALIKRYGVPFATLLYMKGHIMIYIGMAKEEPAIFHSFWSIKTINKGQFIVGGSFITSLAPGVELEEFDHHNGTLLDKLTAIRVLQ